MISSRSSLYVYLSLLLAGMCILSVTEYFATQEGAPGAVLCFLLVGHLSRSQPFLRRKQWRYLCQMTH